MKYRNLHKIILLSLCLLMGFACGGKKEATVADKDKIATVKSDVGIGAEKEPAFREDFNGTIDESKWIIGTWSEHHGQMYRSTCFTQDGNLNLLWKNETGPEPPWIGSAIQLRQKFLYGKWEARLKVSSTPGVLCSFYTIDWGQDGEGTRQEIDIEFLTRTFGENSGKIHLALHKGENKNDEGGQNSQGWNIDLGFNPSDDFHVYGFSVYPDKIEWHVDGKIIKTHVYDKVHITVPYSLKLNHWTDPHPGGWVSRKVGVPPVGTTSTYLIDWIQFTPFDV